MNQSLKNKTAVITGAGGQIGFSTAQRLSAQGARIIGIVRRDSELVQTRFDSLPNPQLQHLVYQASITDTQSLKSVAAKIERCDILVNAAGINDKVQPKDFELMSDEKFDEIITTNIRGTFAVIREFTPLLKKQESLVINLSSQSSQRGSTSNLAYGASKAAIDLMTRSLARVLAPTVRVIAICPGYLESATSGLTRPPGFNDAMSKEIPMGRVATGDDVAALIESLSTTVTYMTGNIILLEGGRLC